MRTTQGIQVIVGLAIVVFGLLLLLFTNGWLAVTMLDLAGVALILSGVLFAVPGFVWRRSWPWLTSFFIPSALTFALGLILLYTGRAHRSELWYLWFGLVVALGVAFLAMYYFGPRVRWLWWTGITIGSVSLLLLALSLALFGSLAPARTAGALVLIALGLAFALSGLFTRHSSADLVLPRQ